MIFHPEPFEKPNFNFFDFEQGSLLLNERAFLDEYDRGNKF